MSCRETAAAMAASVSPAEKLVLLLLAEGCGDTDDCHVNLACVRRFSGMPEEGFGKVLAALEWKGFIEPRGPSEIFDDQAAFWFRTDKLDAIALPDQAETDVGKGVAWQTA